METPRNSSLPAGFLRSSRTMRLVLAPAGQTQSIQRIAAAGVRFYITDADSSEFIGIKTDKTVQERFQVGTGKDFTLSGEIEYFEALEVENFSASTIIIILFAGFGDYIDKRTTIANNRLSSILPTFEPDTQLVAVEQPGSPGVGLTTLAASSSIALTGVPNALQLRRKAVVISNNDQAAVLLVDDQTNKIAMSIQPKTEITLPVSQGIRIRNDTGSPIPCNFAEIWWMKPAGL